MPSDDDIFQITLSSGTPNNFARVSRFFVHFFAVAAQPQRESV